MDNLFFIMLAVVTVFVLLIFINKMAISGMNKAFYQKKWKEIEGIAAQSKMGGRLAIIEADKLVDHALKAKGVKGNTMGERLKSASSILVNRNDIWESHKLRNRLVHEQDVKLGRKQIQVALAAFKKTLKGLGAL